MKSWLLWGVLPIIAGCSTITADPWRWMDEPNAQRWVPIEVKFQDVLITFDFPTKANGSTYQVRSDQSLPEIGESIRIEVPVRNEFQAVEIVNLHWDYWWGGFLKESGTDFVLSLYVGYHGANVAEPFWNMTPEEFMMWRREYWDEQFSGPDPWFHQRFFETYSLDKHLSAKSLTWVCENRPPRTDRLTRCLLPLGEDHVLNFYFYINEKSRNGLEPDPAWVERRWEMAYKILDTVEITPRPGKF